MYINISQLDRSPENPCDVEHTAMMQRTKTCQFEGRSEALIPENLPMNFSGCAGYVMKLQNHEIE